MSGAMTRSTEECEMSRSCQVTTFSSAGITAERITRDSPVRFSDSTGLRLCGIADEPFWPSAKYSDASRNSVRCRWRSSVAKRSIAAAISASAMKNTAWRSRGMIWVETGSGSRPSFFGDIFFDPRVDIGEGADRAGNLAGGDFLPRRDEPLRLRANSA